MNKCLSLIFQGVQFRTSWKPIFLTSLTLFALATCIYFFLSYSITHLISVYFRPEQEIYGMFNANQLFLPYLFQDIFLHHAPYHDWTVSPVHYFFPDGFIFFIWAIFTQNSILAVLLSNVTLLVLYYLMLVKIGIFVSGAKNKNLFRLFALLSLFLACGHLSDQEVMIPLWSSHFGSTIVIYLIGIFYCNRLLSKPAYAREIGGDSEHRTGVYMRVHEDSSTDSTNKNSAEVGFGKKSNETTWQSRIGLSLLLFLTSLSDPFFFIVFCIPIAASLFIVNRSWWSPAMIILFGALGFLANFFDWFHLHIASYFHLKTNTAPTFHFSTQAFLQLYKTFALYAFYNPLIILIDILFLLMGIKLLLTSFSSLFRYQFIFISITLSILISLFSSLFLDQDLLHNNFLGLRHFQTAILLPAFLCLPLLLAQYEKIALWFNQAYPYFVIFFLACLFLFQPHRPVSFMLNFYPPLTQCLDQHADELINKNGIAHYWDAHLNNIFSKKNLNIVAINRYNHPYNWMSTRHDYQHKKFHFIIVRYPTFPPEKVIKKWGTPDTILGCSYLNNYSIFVYKQGFSLH